MFTTSREKKPVCAREPEPLARPQMTLLWYFLFASGVWRSDSDSFCGGSFPLNCQKGPGWYLRSSSCSSGCDECCVKCTAGFFCTTQDPKGTKSACPQVRAPPKSFVPSFAPSFARPPSACFPLEFLPFTHTPFSAAQGTYNPSTGSGSISDCLSCGAARSCPPLSPA